MKLLALLLTLAAVFVATGIALTPYKRTHSGIAYPLQGAVMGAVLYSGKTAGSATAAFSWWMFVLFVIGFAIVEAVVSSAWRKPRTDGETQSESS